MIQSLSLSRRRLLQATTLLPAASMTSAFAQAKTSTALTVGFVPIAGAASLIVGEQQGYFEAEGITLNKEIARVPNDTVANLIGGRLQIGSINVGGLSQAAIRGLPLKVVGSTYYSEGKDAGLFVKTDSPVKSMSDLKGKSVALGQLKNNAHAALLQQLDAAGVDLDSVKISLIPVTNAVAALRAGTVDGALIVEPFITMAGGAIRSICDNLFSVSEKRTVAAHYITTQQFAREQPAKVASFTRALNRAHEYSAKNPEAVRKAVGMYTDIPPEVLTKMNLPQFSSDLGLDSINRQIEVMIKYKILASTPDLRAYFA